MNTDKEPKRIVRKVQSNYDITLVLVILFLAIFGLIMIYSTSSYNAARYYGDAQLYFRKQSINLVIGFAFMLVVSMIDYRLYIKPLPGVRIKPIWLLYILCIGLQSYVLINGYAAGGSMRWIRLPGGAGFQPSEITKICFILLVAYLVQRAPRKLDKFTGFLIVAICMLPLLILVAIQNLSTALILAAILTVICFVVSRKKAYFIAVGMSLVAFAGVFIAFVGYRSDRIKIWLDVENSEDGFQVLQGLYAIASGGMWGKGLGESMQKLGYIPEVHTDMIFSIICEELGMFGGIVVIALFLILIVRLFMIACYAPDLFGGLIATGIMIHIAIQVIINIAVVTNSIPATGIPLPFISYGGSSLVVIMIEMGLALSVSKYTSRESIPI